MEILIALVPVLAWGSTGLVSGKIGDDASQQTLEMTIGAFLLFLVVFSVVSPVITPQIFLIGLLSGLAWSARQSGQFHGVKYTGISVGLPSSTSFQLVLNATAGAVFFHEWTQTEGYVYGITALVLLVSGAYLTARQDDEGGIDTDSKIPDFGKGFRALIFSTIGYGVYTVVINWVNLDAMSVILPQSIGMISGASFFAFRKVRVDQFVWKNMICGLSWGLGNVCMPLTVKSLGLAADFSFSQMGIVTSTLGGVFILGEEKTKEELIYVIVGCLLVTLDGILLGYMETV